MKINDQKLLPKIAAGLINGGIYAQNVRCGKPSCRCARGELHKGYFYLFRRVKGKLVKTYVPKAEVIEVMQAFEAARDDRKALRKINDAATQTLRVMRAELKAQEGMIKLSGMSHQSNG